MTQHVINKTLSFDTTVSCWKTSMWNEMWSVKGKLSREWLLIWHWESMFRGFSLIWSWFVFWRLSAIWYSCCWRQDAHFWTVTISFKHSQIVGYWDKRHRHKEDGVLVLVQLCSERAWHGSFVHQLTSERLVRMHLSQILRTLQNQLLCRIIRNDKNDSSLSMWCGVLFKWYILMNVDGQNTLRHTVILTQ